MFFVTRLNNQSLWLMTLVILCTGVHSGMAVAQTDEEGPQLTALLRLQPELVSVSGSAAEARGSDGFTITDGWAGGNKNSANFGALFIDSSQPISGQWGLFARLGLNIDAEGLKDGDSKNRDVYVGLATPLGRISAGRIATAYKTAGIGWDPLNATFMQSRGNLARSGGAFGHGGYLDRSIAYGNTLGSVRINATLSFDDELAGDLTSDNDPALSASVISSHGPIQLLAAYVDGSGYEGGASDRDAVKLGALYQKGPWSTGIMHESRGQGLEDGDNLFITSSYRMDKWRFSTNLGLFDDNKDVNDGTYFALGARYELHNLVSVHGGIRQIDRDLTGKETIAGLGLRFILKSGNLVR